MSESGEDKFVDGETPTPQVTQGNSSDPHCSNVTESVQHSPQTSFSLFIQAEKIRLSSKSQQKKWPNIGQSSQTELTNISDLKFENTILEVTTGKEAECSINAEKIKLELVETENSNNALRAIKPNIAQQEPYSLGRLVYNFFLNKYFLDEKRMIF